MGYGLDALTRPLNPRVTDFERETVKLRVEPKSQPSVACGLVATPAKQVGWLYCHECHGCSHECHGIAARAIRRLRA